MSLTHFQRYINSLDKYHIKIYQIKKELIIYIARENIKDKLDSNKFNCNTDSFDVLNIYDYLQSLEIEDILKMSKKEDLDKCASRYLNIL